MLAQRILDTVRFFDLQDLPLTSFEINKYLIADKTNLKTKLDHRYEILPIETPQIPAVHMDTIQTQLHILTREEKLFTTQGHYCLPNREKIIYDRLRNYLNGIKRERLVRRFLKPTKHLPFVRGIALAGSQAMGQQRPTSDIDLLIITDTNHMWIARTFLSAWFQLFGVRRHGNKIANRFCLNHYLANPREVDAERNLYKAMEYIKLRPVVGARRIAKFQRSNEKWIRQFFPNVAFPKVNATIPRHEYSSIQNFLESILNNAVGSWLERQLGNWQKKRIRQDQFVFVREDELSFHPDSKHEALLNSFFV